MAAPAPADRHHDVPVPTAQDRLAFARYLAEEGRLSDDNVEDDGPICGRCGEPLDLLGDDETCGSCLAPLCPFCPSFGGVECVHEIASADFTDGGMCWVPFDESDLCLPEDSGDSVFDDDLLREAFGPLYSLLEAYEDDYGSLLHPSRIANSLGLLDLMLARLGIAFRSETWTDPCGDLRSVYYAEDPERARAALKGLAGRLAGGFERLATILSIENRD